MHSTFHTPFRTFPPNILKSESYKVGQRIEYIRTKQGLTQENLGIRLGLEIHEVFSYEKGTRVISIEDLFEFAKALGVPANELIDFGEQK